MQEHVSYWSNLASRSAVVVFGPVADPQGAWGVAILDASSKDEVDQWTSDDPVMCKIMGMRWDAFPMPQTIFGQRYSPRNKEVS